MSARFLQCPLAVCAMVALIAFGTSSHKAQANLLVNEGFEAPITYDGPPFVGSWEGFSGAFSGGTAISANGAIMPRSGPQHLDLLISNDASAFAGAFQDVAGLTPGQIGTFIGWHKLFGGNPGGTEIRIEWRDSVNDVEIMRTPNLTPTIGSSYERFSLTDTVPVGADTARVVYAIQSFTGSGDQNVFVDDTIFVVPEPAALALMGLAGLAITTMRRRR